MSVWLRRLSTDRIERRLAAPDDTPRVVVAAIEQAQRIVAMNDAAARLRLRPDMPLADARAMYPSLPVFEADFEADRRLLEAVADWCDRYTPLVGLDPPDGLFLDITGCAHLYNGEATLARDLLTRLKQQGFAARVAVADTPGCAWGVARYGKQGFVPRGGNEAAMLPLPIAALRTDAGTVADLKTSGLVTVGDLAARPRAPFVARFGAGLILRLDRALGRADEPIRPRLPVPAAMAEQRFPDPIAREEDVLGTIEQLAGRLATLLERRGEGGRLFQVALFRADGRVHRLELGTGAPLRDPPRVRKLYQERLAVLADACDPGFGYDMIRLSAVATERVDSVQTGLAGGDHADELTHLIDRLGARFGLRRVTRLVPQDTHIPEYAVAALPAHAPAAFFAAIEARDDLAQDSLSPVRPLHLFEHPESVEAIAQVPDGPPVRFNWRRTLHHVVRVEGPERIEMEWWRDDRGNRLARDYFRVESRTGMRAWLYREGFYSDKNPHPHWYLHGLFA
ncbi:MAG: DNA polymerase Y family protein [Xanthobacteraceae bacterium]|nr:DNA polymerase Y family protein [Xanthobacteraceae bacterium]